MKKKKRIIKIKMDEYLHEAIEFTRKRFFETKPGIDWNDNDLLISEVINEMRLLEKNYPEVFEQMIKNHRLKG